MISVSLCVIAIIYNIPFVQKSTSIPVDLSDLSNHVFALLKSGSWLHGIRTRTNRLCDIFLSQPIQILKVQNPTSRSPNNIFVVCYDQ